MYMRVCVQLHKQKHNKLKPAKNKHGELYYAIQMFPSHWNAQACIYEIKKKNHFVAFSLYLSALRLYARLPTTDKIIF